MRSDKAYSAGELVDILGIPYHKVIRKLKKGSIKGAHKVGWGWIIPSESVEQVLDIQLVSTKFEWVKK